jgi:aryl-alcohol dehydrogenase-like predicted oxidoreductase
MIIATKGGHYDLASPDISRVNKREVEIDLDDSLLTLGLDQIDFYWLHRDNESLPIEEIIDFMEGFVKDGKIRYYGASNYRLERMKQAREYATSSGLQGFSALSNQWSLAKANTDKNAVTDLVSMTDEYHHWHVETKMPLVPYTSTANGFFEKMHSGRLSPEMEKAFVNEENMNTYKLLLEMKEKYNVSIQALSLAFLMNQPFDVIPICGVSTAEQLRDFALVGDIVKKAAPQIQDYIKMLAKDKE